MWECNFANEPADHKLMWLLFLKKIKWILAAVLLGAVLGSGVYLLVNSVFAPPKEYQVRGEIYVDYQVVDGYGISLTCYNAETWNTMIRSDEFVDRVLLYADEQGMTLDPELVRESIFAELISDSRLLFTTVTMKDPAAAVAVSHGLLQAIITFGEGEDGVKEIRIMSDPDEAVSQMKENRIFSAALTGAVLFLFLSSCGLLLLVAMDDSIYVPITFEKRYQIPSLGTLSSSTLQIDLSHLFQNAAEVAVLSLQEDIPVEQVAEQLSHIYGGTVFVPFQNGEESAAEIEKIHKMDACLLVAASGKHDGKRIERTLSFLNRHDLIIKGALLWGTDEKLLSRYYGHQSGSQKGKES